MRRLISDKKIYAVLTQFCSNNFTQKWHWILDIKKSDQNTYFIFRSHLTVIQRPKIFLGLRVCKWYQSLKMADIRDTMINVDINEIITKLSNTHWKAYFLFSLTYHTRIFHSEGCRLQANSRFLLQRNIREEKEIDFWTLSKWIRNLLETLQVPGDFNVLIISDQERMTQIFECNQIKKI